MGICWSEPPNSNPPVQQVTYRKCIDCGRMNRDEYCQSCLQRNAMSYSYPHEKPSAPPMYPPQPQYTYAQPQQSYTQQQPYTYAQVYPQQQMYYYPQQQVFRPAQQQSNMANIATAAIGGYVLGSVLEDMMDPN